MRARDSRSATLRPRAVRGGQAPKVASGARLRGRGLQHTHRVKLLLVPTDRVRSAETELDGGRARADMEESDENADPSAALSHSLSRSSLSWILARLPISLLLCGSDLQWPQAHLRLSPSPPSPPPPILHSMPPLSSTPSSTNPTPPFLLLNPTPPLVVSGPPSLRPP